jgi:N-methylhydantoinase B
MTNTMNTPVEALEAELPVRVVRYTVRQRSGGLGFHAGGDGIDREIEFLTPAQVTLLTERRSVAPSGLNGGRPGRPGVNQLRHGKRECNLPAKATILVVTGDSLRVSTPGGGGWGMQRPRKTKPRRRR